MQEDEKTQVTTREVSGEDRPTTTRQQVTETRSSVDGRIIGARIVWYITGIIIALLAVRVALLLFGANQSALFVNFIYSLSSIFAAPFYGIFPEPTYGVSTLDSASIVAIVVYALVAWGIAKLFTLTARRTQV